MWTCPNCAEPNDDEAPVCAVCATRQVTDDPAARRPASSSAPSSPAPTYPAPADPWAPPEVEPITGVPTMPTPAVQSPAPPAAEDPGFRGRPPALRWIVAVALILLVGAGVAAAIVVPRWISSRHDQARGTPAPTVAATTTGIPATADPTDTTTDPTTTEPTTEPASDPPAAGGIVALGPGLTDGRATGVAAMFDTYFGGINDKDYDAVGSVLDPAGSVDPGNQAQMSELAEGTRSTTDSNAVLTALGDAAGGLLSAEVTFQSTQNPGDGPRGRSGETCTQWDIRYTVSGGDGAYRIRKSRARSTPC